MENNYFDLLLQIISGILTAIPLIYALVKKTKEVISEKNWPYLMATVIEFMEVAEEKFSDGATRKKWVLAMVQVSSEYANYPVDLEFLSEMIDTLCDFSKIVNYNEEEETEGATDSSNTEETEADGEEASNDQVLEDNSSSVTDDVTEEVPET